MLRVRKVPERNSQKLLQDLMEMCKESWANEDVKLFATLLAFNFPGSFIFFCLSRGEAESS